MDTSELFFEDLTPIEVPVTIGGKKYVLREASEEAACKYRNALLRGTKLNAKGKPTSFEGMADAEPILVSLCLFEQYEQREKDGTLGQRYRPVLLQTILGWRQKVVKALFERAQEISDLKEETDTQEVLQERFADTCEALVALSESDDDRRQWGEWLHNAVNEKLGTVPDRGPQEDQVKNGQERQPAATAITLRSPASSASTGTSCSDSMGG